MHTDMHTHIYTHTCRLNKLHLAQEFKGDSRKVSDVSDFDVSFEDLGQLQQWIYANFVCSSLQCSVSCTDTFNIELEGRLAAARGEFHNEYDQR